MNAIPTNATAQMLIDSIRDYAIIKLNRNGIVATWNTGAENIYGYAALEIVGRHFSVFHTDEDRINGAPQQALAMARAEGRHEWEGWRLRKDGSRFWANVVINAIGDQFGAVTGFAVIVRDISEQMRMEKQFEDCNLCFSTLVNAATGHAIYQLDEHGRIASWNAGAARLKGYTTPEVLGLPYAMFFTEEDQKRCMPELALAMARQHGSYQKDGWRVRKDGSRFGATTSVYPITSDEGRVTGFVVVTHDLKRALTDV
jgi:PAS domain S-box-containing protein